ncbi:MAG: acyl-CoA thioesterase [Treponema sp.]|nr:acyl-CoA thioesterase [Treponema sp.]
MSNNFISVEKEFTVEFYDVDSMQIVWHGNYVKFMEVGRCALLDKIGFGYKIMEENNYAFPVVDMKLKFIRPLEFREKCKIRSTLTEYESCIKIKYEIFNQKGELANKAESTQMAVNMKTNQSEMNCPEIFIKKVQALME